MVIAATENCYKCGKEISLKNVASYKVLPNYRLICVDCATADGLIGSPKTIQTASETVKKQPQR